MEPLTLDSLPPDVIYTILHLASSQLKPRLVNGKRPRLQLLLRASLICRSWREPAQALLSQNISLVRNEIERWVNAPAANGVRPITVELTATGLNHSSLEMESIVRGAIGKSAGVRSLMLAGAGVGLEVMQLEGLADLTHLNLDFAFLPSKRPIPIHTFPFHLTSLSLCAISDSSAILPLFTCSSATLRHLDISSLFVNTRHTLKHPTPYGTVLEHFHLVASAVTSLSIKLWRDDVAAFAQLLGEATALQSLKVSVHDGSQDDLAVILDMVRAPLRSLKLARWPAAAWGTLGECLRESKALEHLINLTVYTIPSLDDREAFVAECATRRIKVSIETL